MSAVIDPVTGLPDLSAGVVDQIPLGSQLVDWHGLKAVQLPPRAPVYPDDGFPVLSDLQAWQNTNPDAIEKLYTDANHALWVHVVNQAAGGGSIGPFSPTEGGGDGGAIVNSGGVLYGGSFGFSSHDPIRLLSVEVSPRKGGVPSVGWCEWGFGITNNGLNPNITLAQGNFHSSDWTSTPLPRTRWVMPYPALDWFAAGFTPNVVCFFYGTSDGDINICSSYTLGH